ncbi:MAG TPA: flavoprotein [bacterium]|nr:flavoprotein [bacterium]HOM26222.1 flavoprotein [bacterium]
MAEKLKRKNIVVGVTGSIAIYKSCEVVRNLIKNNWSVKVVMTENAKKFVSPLTFETLSRNPVYSDMFEKKTYEEDHIALADFASIILVCPATANIIGKVSSGICDDLLTATIFAFSGPVIFAPAMNENMWLNSIVQENVKKLKKHGYYFVEPEEGELASGKTGKGRLAKIEKIIDFVEKVYNKH